MFRGFRILEDGTKNCRFYYNVSWNNSFLEQGAKKNHFLDERTWNSSFLAKGHGIVGFQTRGPEIAFSI